mgnify:CR=1 FL=1
MQNPSDYLEAFDVDPIVEKCKRCGKDMQYTKDGIAYCSCWMPTVDISYTKENDYEL